jgi:hypothetical protein
MMKFSQHLPALTLLAMTCVTNAWSLTYYVDEGCRSDPNVIASGVINQNCTRIEDPNYGIRVDGVGNCTIELSSDETCGTRAIELYASDENSCITVPGNLYSFSVTNC